MILIISGSRLREFFNPIADCRHCRCRDCHCHQLGQDQAILLRKTKPVDGDKDVEEDEDDEQPGA